MPISGVDAFVDLRDAQHSLNHTAIADDYVIRFLKMHTLAASRKLL